MPIDPAHSAPPREPETDATAVFGPDALGSAEGGYAARYAEDSFDYPEHASPPPSQSWSAGGQPPDVASAPGPTEESDSTGEGQRRADRARSRPAGRWQQRAARRRPVLMVAAALVVMSGFGVALSMVSDTVSSDSVPSGSGGTAQVSAPKSPTEPTLPPAATASASPPAAGGDGVSVAPTATSLLPGAGHQRDDGRGEDDREDDGSEGGEREDGDDDG
ncbi:hypothetical protein [Streptomyces sp. NPDC007991]|uniref:hypothetical protein n=1 Tax=Streptomyces sp. NPDC007991 TaxID=3364803 RepID=UPI0036E8685D